MTTEVQLVSLSGHQEKKEALIKSRKSACLEKLPSEVGDIQGGLAPLFSESLGKVSASDLL